MCVCVCEREREREREREHPEQVRILETACATLRHAWGALDSPPAHGRGRRDGRRPGPAQAGRLGDVRRRGGRLTPRCRGRQWDYSLGAAFRDELLPRAVEWYLGEAGSDPDSAAAEEEEGGGGGEAEFADDGAGPMEDGAVEGAAGGGEEGGGAGGEAGGADLPARGGVGEGGGADGGA